MKNRLNILVPVLILALVVTCGDTAVAGLFGRSKDKDTEKELKTWRFDRQPTMNFARGILSQDSYGSGWDLGEITIHVTKKCKVIGEDGKQTVLRAGREAVIMGPRVGNTIVAWQIRILEPNFMQPMGDSGIVAKTIARYGDDAQKERWLASIRSGDIHFSLGYSEPEAGSDLASVRCRAELHGDVYVVTGEKCWQSYAQDMDFLWLLCRTGEQESRGRGLTLLIVDLAAPGVRVGALPTLDGDQLNDVHLDHVD